MNEKQKDMSEEPMSSINLKLDALERLHQEKKPITMERLDGSIDLMLDADSFQKTIPVYPLVMQPPSS